MDWRPRSWRLVATAFRDFGERGMGDGGIAVAEVAVTTVVCAAVSVSSFFLLDDG